MPSLARVAALVLLLPLAGCSSGPDGDTRKNNETNDGLSFDGVTLSLTDASGTLTADLSSLQDDVPGLVRTRIVSPVPGDPLAGGAALMAAVATLVPAPSATNPWVIRMEPGLYDLGSGTVDIPGFVSLQGAGRGATRIIGTGDPQVLSMTDAAELRDLAVVVTSVAVNNAVGILTEGTGGARIQAVELSATGFGSNSMVGMVLKKTTTVVDSQILFSGAGSGSTTGVITSVGTSSVLRQVEVELLRPEVLNLYGLHLEGSARVEGGSVTLEGLAGLGIEVFATNTAIIGVDVSATGSAVPGEALFIVSIVDPLDVEVRNSKISGGTVFSGQGTLRVSFSQLGGSISIDPMVTALCANSIGLNYGSLPPSCVP